MHAVVTHECYLCGVDMHCLYQECGCCKCVDSTHSNSVQSRAALYSRQCLYRVLGTTSSLYCSTQTRDHIIYNVLLAVRQSEWLSTVVHALLLEPTPWLTNGIYAAAYTNVCNVYSTPSVVLTQG